MLYYTINIDETYRKNIFIILYIYNRYLIYKYVHKIKNFTA